MARSVCGAEARLPATLITQALLIHGPGATWSSVKTRLRCLLETHAAGVHQGCVVSATGDHAVWASWAQGREPSFLLRRLDCPDERGCGLFNAHGGGHSGDLYDPLMADARAEADRLLGRTMAATRSIR